MFSTRLAGLGLLIMTMVGFASYMTHIGANDAFVNIAIKPLSIIKSPYALVFLAFLLGKAVSMVITSAVGLGVLCLALMGPALAALGMNKKAIGAVLSPPVQLHSFSSAAQLRLRRRLARSRFLITFCIQNSCSASHRSGYGSCPCFLAEVSRPPRGLESPRTYG